MTDSTIEPATRAQRVWGTWMRLGLLGCLTALMAGGVAGAATTPSTVNVTGAWHGNYRVTDPSSRLWCEVVRKKGYYEIGLLVNLTKRAYHTQQGLQHVPQEDLIVVAPAGRTVHFPDSSTLSDGSKPSAAFIVTRADRTWIINSNISSAGSGTLRISANGRSGSLNAELPGDPIPISHPTAGEVHVKASWDCTSKEYRGT